MFAMPFSRVAEMRIREAMAQGEFENLPGAGQPVSLEEYFSAPEDLRIGYSLLRNAGCAPAEVELLKEVSQLELALATPLDPAKKRELQRTLARRRTELAIALERRSSRAK